MKLHEMIPEMTATAEELPYLENIFLKHKEEFEKNKSGWSNMGDMEKYKVLKKNNIYLFTLDSEVIGYAETPMLDAKSCLLNQIFIIKEQREKGITKNFLILLLKQHSVIKIGDVQSKNMRGTLRKLSDRFKMHWENDTGETEEYNEKTWMDPARGTKTKFYSVKPTKWQVVITR